MSSTFSAVRRVILAQPGAYEDFPFGAETSVFKIRTRREPHKMFALMFPGSSLPGFAGPTLNVKAEPEFAIDQRRENSAIAPAYHMSKKHWNSVDVGGDISLSFIRELIDDSYDLVVSRMPRKDQVALGWNRLAQER